MADHVHVNNFLYFVFGLFAPYIIPVFVLNKFKVLSSLKHLPDNVL